RLRFVLSQPSREEAAGRLGHPTHLWLEAGRGKAKKVRSSSALVLLRRLQPTAGSGVCNLLLLLSHVNCNVGKKRSTQIALPVSGSMHRIVDPLGACAATCSAPAKVAPEEMPTKMPSLRASSLLQRMASAFGIRTTWLMTF